MEKVKSLISIGSSCRTRYQLDVFLKKKLSIYEPSSFFFDYLMMGGLSGVINLIQREFVLSSDDIYAFEQEGKFIPRDRNSGMAFLHDFGTSNWWATEAECMVAYETQMQSSLSKFAYLGQKTHNLLLGGNHVGLVYHGVTSDEGLRQLQFLLSEKYNQEFLIVNVVEHENADSLSPVLVEKSILRVFVCDVLSPKNGTAKEWEGWDDSWVKALSHIPLYNE